MDGRRTKSDRELNAYRIAGAVVVVAILGILAIAMFGDQAMAICACWSGPAVALYACVMIGLSHDTLRAMPGVIFAMVAMPHLAWSQWISTRIPAHWLLGLDEFSTLVLVTGSVFAAIGATSLRSPGYGLIMLTGTSLATASTAAGAEAIGIGTLHIGIALGLAWYVRSHAARVRQPNRCPSCGYDCAGITSGVCPECGRSSTTPTSD